uniref:Shisa N-terminal domain-containing protein n=1 Tax=Periophthalmus magnuspinnatus TaxID=409849 RepID=A0A3B3ZP92_9GOBI
YVIELKMHLLLFLVFFPAQLHVGDCRGDPVYISGQYHAPQKCRFGFCCGSCYNRYCCHDSFWKLSEDKQDEWYNITTSIMQHILQFCFSLCLNVLHYTKLTFVSNPVIATTTHTTVVTSSPQTYPQQPTATPQPYPAAQYAPYQPIPVQPGYGTQPMPYQGAPYIPGPPPTYQEATGPSYPAAPMPYSQAAFTPGQPSYPLQPPGPSPSQPQPQPQPTDFLTQPAYNPDYVSNKM